MYIDFAAQKGPLSWEPVRVVVNPESYGKTTVHTVPLRFFSQHLCAKQGK